MVIVGHQVEFGKVDLQMEKVTESVLGTMDKNIAKIWTIE